MRLEKDTDFFLVCPCCGERYQLIGQKEGKWICWECGFQFAPEGQDIPREAWKEEPVKSVRCDRCGNLVSCTPANFGSQTSPQGKRRTVLFCPRPECQDRLKDRPNWLQNHALAVKYRGKWYKPQAFLDPNTQDALR